MCKFNKAVASAYDDNKANDKELVENSLMLRAIICNMLNKSS